MTNSAVRAEDASVPLAVPDSAKLAGLLAAQTQYFERIRAANAAGDANAVQQLLSELDRKSREFTTPASEPPRLALVAEAPPPPLYEQAACGTDLMATVYDGDRDLFQALIEDGSFGDPLDRQPSSAGSADIRRKALLNAALRLTPRLAPGVHAVIDRCRTQLGLTAGIEVYVYPDTGFVAFCHPPVPVHGKYSIVVTSALLERFTPGELAFVIGHELGHALFGHDRLPAAFLPQNGSGLVSPLQALRRYGWKRAAELSADRIGLICAPSFAAAAEAAFKLSSGVAGGPWRFELSDYAAQFADLESERASHEVGPEEWFGTHPFSPMRLTALGMFNRSETYLRLRGKEGEAELSEEQLEFEIKKIMSVTEAAYLHEGTEQAALMRRFAFTAGYFVMATAGVLDDSGVAALGTLLDPTEADALFDGVLSKAAADVRPQVAALAEKLGALLPDVSKLNVMKDLVLIASPGGIADAAALAALYDVAGILGIRSAFVDHVLAVSQADG